MSTFGSKGQIINCMFYDKKLFWTISFLNFLSELPELFRKGPQVISVSFSLSWSVYVIISSCRVRISIRFLALKQTNWLSYSLFLCYHKSGLLNTKAEIAGSYRKDIPVQKFLCTWWDCPETYRQSRRRCVFLYFSASWWEIVNHTHSVDVCDYECRLL